MGHIVDIPLVPGKSHRWGAVSRLLSVESGEYGGRLHMKLCKLVEQEERDIRLGTVNSDLDRLGTYLFV
jgi:hypothetical protein